MLICVLSVPCSLVITCWEWADFLALLLLCVVLSCVFVTYLYGVPGQEKDLIVSIPDLYLPLYLELTNMLGHVFLNKKIFMLFLYINLS